jgi:hypothetical protein
MAWGVNTAAERLLAAARRELAREQARLSVLHGKNGAQP